MTELLGRPSGAWAWVQGAWGRAWLAEVTGEEGGGTRARLGFCSGRAGSHGASRKVWSKVIAASPGRRTPQADPWG